MIKGTAVMGTPIEEIPVPDTPQPAETHSDVVVNEEVIWKARAEEAESNLASCEARVAELEAEVESLEGSLRTTQRRGTIERELTAARAVDLETACLLTEAAIGEMDEPDVAVAVRELRARKPFLFACSKHTRQEGGASTMSPHSSESSAQGLGRIADTARMSGDRNELLRYLRARRGG